MSVPTLRHDDSLSSDDNPEHHTPVTPASASDATPIHRRTSSGATVGSLFRRLSALSARISLTAPRHPRGLVWAETVVLPEKCIALEIQARKDLVALSLDDDDANPDSPASFAAVVKRSDKALASFFVLGVRATSPGGIVRELISRAARHGLVPSSHRFREQCVDAMLREDADDEELEKTGTNSWNSTAALDHSFVSSASTSARLAPRGDMGTASPWNRAINGRGFIVAVAKVPGLTRRVVIVGRLKTPSLLGIDSCARVRVVALALSGVDSGSEPPAKTGAATAHTVATLLNDDAFFSAALRAKAARDVRAAVLTFVKQKSGSAAGGEVDSIHRTPPPLHPTRAKSRQTPRSFEWPFASVARDARCRLPHYVSDWTDAFRDGYSFSKTINATTWLYFSTLAPALALGVVLREETRGAIGPTEVLLAEGVGNMAFSLVAGSPLLVLRVTGTAVAWTKILSGWFHGGGGVFAGEDFLAFHAAVGLWCAGFVIFIASVGGAGLMRHAGSFTHEILAALVSGIFIRSGVAEVVAAAAVTDEMDDAEVDEHPAFFLKHLMLFLGTFYVARAVLGFQRSPFLGKNTRTVIADMAPAISLVSLTLLSYAVAPDVGVKRANITDDTPMSRAQLGTSSLGNLSPSLAALAAVPGAAFAVQVFVESNAASILTAAPANALVKGGGRGLHLDMLGVGCVIAAASVWSCPMPMGTIPHSPQHARVLATVCEYERRGEVKSKVVSAIETRVSNLVSHALIVLTVLLARDVISAVPTAVMSGFLCYTGWTSLESNGMFKRALLAVTSRECHPTSSYIRRAPLKTLHLYTALQALALLAVFAVETDFFGASEPSPDGFPAGLLFPVALGATILVKAYLLPFVPAFSFAFLSAVNGRDDSEFFY